VFANRNDIWTWQQRHNNATGRPMAGALADNLAALAQWADDNSDGWSTWPKPARAARTATLLLRDLDNRERESWSTGRLDDLTAADVKRALSPVRAFLTRQGVRPNNVLLPVPHA
jgi:hypothetical protein